MNEYNIPSTDTGLGGGLIAALLAFALTWFVVNSGDMTRDDNGALDSGDFSVCAVPADIPTSRFLNAPILAPVPVSGG